MKKLDVLKTILGVTLLTLAVACQDSSFEKDDDIPPGEVFADGGTTPPRTTETNGTVCTATTGTCTTTPTVNTETYSGTQITYGGLAESCTYEKELLGSLKFKPNDVKHLELMWNNFVPQPGVEAAAYYRVIVYGTKEMTTETSWISQKLTNGYIRLGPELMGDNSPAFPQYPNLGKRLDERVVFNDEQAYWYDIVAFNASGSVILTRHVDVRQTSYNQTFRVVGYCTF